MYEFIRGLVVEVTPSYLVLDNNGIGYHILMANPFRLSKDLNKEVTVYIYQSVTQDAMRLYGFINQEEKNLFLKLIGVSGIGPKSALAILAVEDHMGLVQAIEEENSTYLQKFPGVGKKTAAQIVLDLQGKLADLSPEVFAAFGDGESQTTTKNVELEEALAALTALGYTKRDIKKVTKVLEEMDGDIKADQYIREALTQLIH